MKTHLILDIGYLTEQNSDAWERGKKGDVLKLPQLTA